MCAQDGGGRCGNTNTDTTKEKLSLFQPLASVTTWIAAHILMGSNAVNCLETANIHNRRRDGINVEGEENTFLSCAYNIGMQISR